MSGFVSLQEAAAWMGYRSTESVLRLVANGEIEAWKTNRPGMRGGRWRVSVDSLKSFIARRVSACQEVV